MRVLLQRPRGRVAVGYAVAVAILCAVQLAIGLRLVGETNTDPDAFDQGSYMLMARIMEGSPYPYASDGTRNPLVPWLASVFLDAGSPAFFLEAKRLNVVLGVLGTVALAVFFVGRTGVLAAFVGTGLCAMAVLLPSSTFFGAETLFFPLFLFLFAVGMRLVNENPIRLYAVLGLLAGACYLAKPSATPFVGLFVMASLLRLVGAKRALPWYLDAPGWHPSRLVVGGIVCGMVTLTAIAPRLVHAHQTWGNALYSLPSHWFWADDWETCVARYADCRPARLREMPPAERPTLGGYFQRHTIADALQRVGQGAALRVGQFVFPEKRFRFPHDRAGKPRRVVLPYRGFYIVGLSGLTLAVGAMAWRSGRLRELGPVALPAGLAVATFLLYAAAMGWYAPIGPGHRFILILYLPAVWLLLQACEQLRLAARSPIADAAVCTAQLVICALLMVRAVALLGGPPFERVLYTF
jgi:hypothetical protein